MIYRALYSRSTAALLALVSGLLLAVSQTRAIVDAVGMVHPAWHPAWYWTAAIGFESAILAVGLVMAMTGDKGLWRWEVVLIVVSVVAGFLAAMVGHAWSDAIALARAAATGVMPVQYLAVVMTAHRLASGAAVMTMPPVDVPVVDDQTDDYADDYADDLDDDQTADQADAPADDQAAPPVRPTIQPRPVPPSTGRRRSEDPRVLAAVAAGIPRTTARRWAATGNPALDRYQTTEARAA